MRVISQLIAGETRVVDRNLNSYPTINIQKNVENQGLSRSKHDLYSWVCSTSMSGYGRV